jgi:hypothetical protein
MSYYIGSSPKDVLDGLIKRYFYGMRRNNDGELFFIKADQLNGGISNSVVINELGDPTENFLDFEEGIDFLDVIDENHNIEYDNLRYPQLKWDGRSILYYIDQETGDFVVRISEAYEYPSGISADGY